MSKQDNTDPKKESKNDDNDIEAMIRQLRKQCTASDMDPIGRYMSTAIATLDEGSSKMGNSSSEQKKKPRVKQEQSAESDIKQEQKLPPKHRKPEQIKLVSELNQSIRKEAMKRQTDLEKKLSEAEAELKAKQRAFQKRKVGKEHSDESDDSSLELRERIRQIKSEIEQIKQFKTELLEKPIKLINEQTMAESSAAAVAELKAEQDASKKQKALRQKQKEKSADRYQPTSTDIEGGFVLVDEPVAKPSIGVKTTWSDKGKTLLADSLKEANQKSEDTEGTSQSNNRNGDDSFVVLESLKPRSKNAKKKPSAP